MRARTFRGRVLWGLALLLAFVGGPTGPAAVLHRALDAEAARARVATAGDTVPYAAAADWSLQAAPEPCGTCQGLCSLRYQVPPLAALDIQAESLGAVAIASPAAIEADTCLRLPARAPPARFA